MKKIVFILILMMMSGCVNVNYDPNYDPIQHEIYLMKKMDPTIQ